MSDDIRCPECSNENIWDVDCPDCKGATEVQNQEGEWVMCENCYGEGIIPNRYECSECKHIWDEQ